MSSKLNTMFRQCKDVAQDDFIELIKGFGNRRSKGAIVSLPVQPRRLKMYTRENIPVNMKTEILCFGDQYDVKYAWYEDKESYSCLLLSKIVIPVDDKSCIYRDCCLLCGAAGFVTRTLIWELDALVESGAIRRLFRKGVDVQEFEERTGLRVGYGTKRHMRQCLRNARKRNVIEAMDALILLCEGSPYPLYVLVKPLMRLSLLWMAVLSRTRTSIYRNYITRLSGAMMVLVKVCLRDIPACGFGDLLPVVMDMLVHENKEVVLDAAKIIRAISASTPQHKRELLGAGAFCGIIRVIECSHAPACKILLTGLMNLVRARLRDTPTRSFGDMMSVVTEMLGHADQKVVLDASKIIVAISGSTLQHKRELLSAKALQGIHCVLERPRNKERLRNLLYRTLLYNCVWTVANFCDGPCVHDVVKGGLIPVITNLIESGRARVREKAISVMANVVKKNAWVISESHLREILGQDQRGRICAGVQ